MSKQSLRAEVEPLRYDYQLAHDSWGGAKTARERIAEGRQAWASRYRLSTFEWICIWLAVVGPAVAVWWWL